METSGGSARDARSGTAEGRAVLSAAAWISLLAISDLPDIVIRAITGGLPPWIMTAKLVFAAAFAAAALLARPLRRLAPYALVLLVFQLALTVTSLVRGTPGFQSRYNYAGVSFFRGFAAIFVLDLVVVLWVLAVLFVLKRDRTSFFLAVGDLDAPVEPVRWLGVKPGTRWGAFGAIVTAIATLGILVPTVLAIRPTAAMLAKTVPFIPAILLFAAVNAFNEEVYFRAGFLATLGGILGKGQLMLLLATVFGLSHWIAGSPPGLPGALMTGFLGWFFAKAMLETRGLGWSWIMHFFPDVVIFFSYVLASVRG